MSASDESVISPTPYCTLCNRFHWPSAGCPPYEPRDEWKARWSASTASDEPRESQWDERTQVGVEIKIGDGEAFYSRRGASQTGFLTVRGTGADILAAVLAEVAHYTKRLDGQQFDDLEFLVHRSASEQIIRVETRKFTSAPAWSAHHDGRKSVEGAVRQIAALAILQLMRLSTEGA